MLATVPGWELDVERGPDLLMVKVKNLQETGFDASMLADSLWSVCQRHFTYRMVLELDEVGLLNSGLIGQLVGLYKHIREHDGVLRICGLSTYNLQVLKSCRLDERLCPYQDREEAVMGHPRHPR